MIQRLRYASADIVPLDNELAGVAAGDSLGAAIAIVRRLEVRAADSLTAGLAGVRKGAVNRRVFFSSPRQLPRSLRVVRMPK